MLKIHLIIACSILMAIPCFADDSIEIRYAGYVLQIPAQPHLILSSGSVDNPLIFLYESSHKEVGTSPVDPRISIITMLDESLIKDLEEQENCDYKLFLRDIFLNVDESGCNEKSKRAYSSVMIQGSDYGEWPSQDLDIYYANGEEESLIMIIGSDKPNLLIQTNFMETDRLKEVVSYYLQ